MSGGGRRRLQDQSSGPRSPFGMSSAVIPLARRASVGGSTGAGGPGPRRAEMRDVRGSGPRRGHPQGSDPARWLLPPRRARRSDGHCRAHGTAAASVRTGICSPGGPRPGVPARGRGGRPPRPGSAAPARRHHPSPSPGRPRTHPHPPEPRRAEPRRRTAGRGDAFHAGRRLALQSGAGTGKPPPRPRWPAPPRCPAWQSGQVPASPQSFAWENTTCPGEPSPTPSCAPWPDSAAPPTPRSPATTSRARAAGSHEPAHRNSRLTACRSPAKPGPAGSARRGRRRPGECGDGGLGDVVDVDRLGR